MAGTLTRCGTNCGVGVLDGVRYNNPEALLTTWGRAIAQSYPLTIISDGGDRDNQVGAKRFEKFVTDNKLGTWQISEPAQNPLYGKGHMVRVWVWYVDQKALKEWVSGQEKAAREKQLAQAKRNEIEEVRYRMDNAKAAADAQAKEYADAKKLYDALKADKPKRVMKAKAKKPVSVDIEAGNGGIWADEGPAF